MPRLEPILSREEIETLLGDEPAGRRANHRMQALGIDLLAEDRHVRLLLPTLQIGFARLAESLRRVLTSVLRAEVSIREEPPEVVGGRGMSGIAERAACILALRLRCAGAPPCTAILALDPIFAFSVIERLFGGGGGPPKTPSGRSPTALERRMLTRALSPVIDALNSCLEPAGHFNFEVQSVESRLDLIPGFAPDTTALHVPFTLDIGSQLASFSLALPSVALEPLRGRLGAPAIDAAGTREMSRLVADVPVSISVVLGQTEMSLRQILRLEVGQILTLRQGRGDALPVAVEGVVKWHGIPVQQDGMVAVEITKKDT